MRCPDLREFLARVATEVSHVSFAIALVCRECPIGAGRRSDGFAHGLGMCLFAQPRGSGERRGELRSGGVRNDSGRRLPVVVRRDGLDREAVVVCHRPAGGHVLLGREQ